MKKMNKNGFNPMAILAYWQYIVIIILIFLGYNFIQDYFNPIYCLSDTFENRASIKTHGFEISDSQSSNNQICFRSNNQELVQDMYENIEDKRIQKEFELQMMKEENTNKVINTLLEPHYFYPILLALIAIGFFYFKSKKH